VRRERKRRVYLRMKTLEEAQTLWCDAFFDRRTPSEVVPVINALERVTSEPIFSRRSVPHYHGAAMDGYAVDASKTFGATEVNPIRLKVGADVFPVDTGDPLPPDTNAVIMVEHVMPQGSEIEIRKAVYPWQHVRKVGEDIVAGELIIPANHLLRPADLGALLAAGVTEVYVYRKPKVWIQPTGSELVSPNNAESLEPGEIIEFNGTVLKGLVEECLAIADLKEIVADDRDKIKDLLKQACHSDADVVLINAGSSAGSEDYTADVIEELGNLIVHGVTMMPGKPVVLGEVYGKPVVGIPGYPVSAIIAFEQFVRPLLWHLQGFYPPSKPTVKAVLGRKVASKLGLEEFVRVVVGRVHGKLIAMPIQRGAGVITSLTRAEGIVRIPQEQEGIDAEEEVSIELLRPESSLEWNLIMIGSHDNTIDLLASELKKMDSRLHLTSSNVGSLGGLMAIRKGLTHLAGSHLLDTSDGSYNFSYVERYLKGVPVRIVELVKREQGFLVAPGNPMGIRSVKDLVEKRARFINRQAGAGTRILFDYELDKAGLSPDQIIGYEQEEYTHMAVAVAILSGRADAGMGIFAAAKALGLDFIPVARERYDLIIREDIWSDRKIQLLMKLISSDGFRSSVSRLGGYDASCSGKLRGIWNGEKWLERTE